MTTKYESIMAQQIAEFETVKKAFEAKLQESMKADFEAFFAATPLVHAITWTQYTPHFNDGDPCTFSVNEPDFQNHEDFELEPAGGYGDGGSFPSKPSEYVYAGAADPADRHHDHYVKEIADYEESIQQDGYVQTVENIREMSKFIGSIPEEVMNAAFGDGVKVVATRDGFEVDEHSHD